LLSLNGKIHETRFSVVCSVPSEKGKGLFFQVCTLRDGFKQGIDQKICHRKSISLDITHPQSALFEYQFGMRKFYVKSISYQNFADHILVYTDRGEHILEYRYV